jgi:hypothetical protein
VRRIRPALAAFACLWLSPVSLGQSTAEDVNEAAYTPATLARIMGGAARSQNDEAELDANGGWFTTTATFTGAKRRPSGRFRPLISSWVGSRGETGDVTDMYFSGELPELQFEQGGKKYWLMTGLPGGLGFDIYPPGQKLTIYVQRIGFASGVPVAVLRMAKLPGGATSATVTTGRRMHNARMGEGERRQEAVFRNGSAKFRYAGREYTLPLDLTGRHSIAPGFYRYANGVRTALLEYGGTDEQYLLLRVTAPEGAEGPTVVPYLVLGGRIVPPIDVTSCSVNVEKVGRDGASGAVDCAGVQRSVLQGLTFSAQ